MINLIILATREGFLQDMILPAAIGIAVIVMLLNQLLKSWGYQLF